VRGRIRAREPRRDVLHALQVGRDVLADSTIAAGFASHERAVFIPAHRGRPVDLRFGHRIEGIGDNEPEGAPRAKLLLDRGEPRAQRILGGIRDLWRIELIVESVVKSDLGREPCELLLRPPPPQPVEAGSRLRASAIRYRILHVHSKSTDRARPAQCHGSARVYVVLRMAKGIELPNHRSPESRVAAARRERILGTF